MKKILSLEAIEDHDIDWLRAVVEAEKNSGSWRFYFDEPIDEETRRDILAELGE